MTKAKVSVFVVLDRSGSMSGTRWENAVSSINTYVDGLVEDGAKGDITVAAFDSNSSWGLDPSAKPGDHAAHIEKLRENVTLSKFKHIAINEVSPRGGTPLYDATAKIIDDASKSKNKKKVILIMTDGEENASREYSLSAIKAKIEKCKADGWEVVYLGAEFNADITAGSMGIASNKVLNVKSGARFASNMRAYSNMTAEYATGKAFDTTQLRTAEDKL